MRKRTADPRLNERLTAAANAELVAAAKARRTAERAPSWHELVLPGPKPKPRKPQPGPNVVVLTPSPSSNPRWHRRAVRRGQRVFSGTLPGHAARVARACGRRHG